MEKHIIPLALIAATVGSLFAGYEGAAVFFGLLLLFNL